jgi:hypothetical protein
VTADDPRVLANRVAELEEAIARHRAERMATVPVGGLHLVDAELWSVLEDDE